MTSQTLDSEHAVQIVLLSITFLGIPMSAVSVTSKGQVTIPVKVRRALGIEPGTRVSFTAENGVAHIVVERRRKHTNVADGAGMLSVRGKARSLADFDAAKLVNGRK